eukprot:CAMPEP_0113844794 /NCGR_PEP_ID=MMETSP0372-20130328/419_1 /TAXON_ID=340204 /ORGANISM="Lankesteria abbotti" /LENGTH=549 /DNA_ID=CAMNT_0000813805 /DNA_START=41 /DNA_END=1690 /DNA_ORIENTATION=+ /assembly_acc=CAM_ASM_000359
MVSSVSSNSTRMVKEMDVDREETYSWQNMPKGLYYFFCLYFGTRMPFALQAVCAATWTGSFVFGFNVSLLNTTVAVIGAQFRWCGCESYTGCTDFKLKSAFIQTGIFIGAAIGAMSAGEFLGRMTCRMVFYIAFLFNLIGVLFSTGAQAFTDLLLARLVGGFGVGLLAVCVPTYIAETTPPRLRGSYGCLHQIVLTIGIYIAVLIGLPFQKPWSSCPSYCFVPDGSGEWACSWVVPTFSKIWWRVMLGLGAVPCLIGYVILMFVFTFETPYYLLREDRIAEGRALLRKLLEKDDIEEDFLAILEQVEETKKAAEEGVSLDMVVKTREGSWALFVGSMISGFQQWTGINIFMTSSNLLFASANLDPSLVTILSMVLCLVNFIFGIPSIWLIEMLGRKGLLLLGCCGMGLPVLPGGIMLLIDEDSQVSTWVAIAGAIIYIIFFSLTWGPVVWVYLFEMFPTNMKDSAAGFMAAVNWAASAIMVFAGNFLPTAVAYLIFSGACLCAFVFVLLFMKETKGRQIGDSPYFKGGAPGKDVDVEVEVSLASSQMTK